VFPSTLGGGGEKGPLPPFPLPVLVAWRMEKGGGKKGGEESSRRGQRLLPGTSDQRREKEKAPVDNRTCTLSPWRRGKGGEKCETRYILLAWAEKEQNQEHVITTTPAKPARGG